MALECRRRTSLNRADAPPEWLRPSPKQIQTMRSFAIQGWDRMNRAEAGVAIAHAMRRWQRGLGTLQFGPSTRGQRHPAPRGRPLVLGFAGEGPARAALVAEGVGQFSR